MTATFARQVLDTIKQYNKIIIFRHFRPDGDAIGSTKGLQRILRLTYPEKNILLINDDYADYLAAELVLLIGDTFFCACVEHESECISIFLVRYLLILAAEDREIICVIIVDKQDVFFGIGESQDAL